MSQEGLLGIQSSPSVPTNFVTDAGTATPALNTLNVLGGTDITTSGAGNTITISFSGPPSQVATLTGNSGGAVGPNGSGNINTVGTGSITVSGNPGTNTLTAQLTGLGLHSVLVGAASPTITNVGPSTAGFVLTSNGLGADPSFQSASASGAILTISGNTGGAESPSAGNFNIVGTGSITIAGSAATETVQLTGLTNHSVLVGAGTAMITKVAPSATNSIPFVSNGAAADPSFGTTNRIGLYITGTPISSGADSDGIFVDASFQPSANIVNAAAIGLYPTFAPPGGVTITTGYGLYVAAGTQGGAGTVTTGYGLFVAPPAFGSSNFSASIGGLVIDNSGTGKITTGVWNGTAVDVAHGGTGDTSLTAYAVLCGGTTSTNPVQSIASVGTAGQVLTSNGAGALPTFQAASASGAITTITGNSGGAESPTAGGNFNILGTGSITVAGSANTETVQLTGLTNHNVLIGAGTATITNVAPSATSGVPLISQGAAADPAFGTAVVAGGGTGATSFNTNGAVISGTSSTAALAAVSLSNQQFLVGNTSAAPTAKTLSVVIQTFTSSGTYTPTSGMVYCISEAVGGGGGGGGAVNNAAFYTFAGGGGGGGYARKISTAAAIGASQTVTIGAAGTAGSSGNNAGGAGGDTSLGAICIGKGGSGGAGNPGSASVAGGAGGVAGTGDFTFPGQTGQPGNYVSTTISFGASSSGGNSYFGTGGAGALSQATSTAGTAASLYGGGGGGGIAVNGNIGGGAGTAGVLIVTEFVIS